MKTKIATITKVYAAAKMLFKQGQELPVSKIAKKAKLSNEGARRHVLTLMKKGLISKDSFGRIIKVK